MGHLCMSLLGSFQAFLDGKPVTGFDSILTRALLAYLAVENDRPHSRETLAGLLWPDRPQAQAMGSLRTALANLRKTIGDQQVRPPFLLITRQAIQFNRESDFWVDVWELDHSYQRSVVVDFTPISIQQPARDNRRSPERSSGSGGGRSPVVDLCRGVFLEGFSLPGSPEFEQWVLVKRAHYLEMALKLMHLASEEAAQEGKYELSLGYVRRILELEPWDEPAHQQAMFLLALSGERTAALAQYQVCRKSLQDELGVEPSEQTTGLYEQILSRSVVFPPGLILTAGERVVTAGPLFVARKKELERLDAALRRALAGKGQVIFITGSPGSGKTALANEFMRRSLLAHPILAAAHGRCQAYFGQGDPYLPFREVLSMLTGQAEERYEAGISGQEATRQLWRSSVPAIQSVVEEGPALVETFLPGTALLRRAEQAVQGRPDWLGRLGEIVRSRQGLPAGEHIQQEALFSQYSSALRALARHIPLVLFLDDLQWADLGSLGLLFALGRSIQGVRILIVGAYRAEEVHPDAAGNRHPLAGVANEFRLLYPDLLLDLDALEERGLVDALLNSQPNCLGQAFREQLFRQTRGHPLFTIELLRGMQERGDLAQDETGRWVESSAIRWDILPDKVEAAIAERIERLPPDLSDFLRAASVEGEGFTLEVAADVQGSDMRAVLKDLNDTLERRLQIVRSEGVARIDGKRLSRYRFRHILFQKYLYGRLDAVLRADLHERVGLALERLYEGQTAEVAGQLARHFEQAGLIQKAVQYLIQAGERAAMQAANAEAIAYFTHALALTPEAHLQGRFDILLKRCRVFELTGDTDRELEDVGVLEELAQVLGPAERARSAMCHLRYTLDVIGDQAGRQLQAELAQTAIAWSRQAGLPEIEAETCIFQAGKPYDDPVQILSIYEHGLALARQAGLKGLEADIYRHMCGNRFLDAPEKRAGYGEQALQLYQEAGDRYGEGRGLAAVATVNKFIGDYAKALHYFETARDVCHEVGNRTDETYSILGVAVANMCVGRSAHLSVMLVQALETVRELNIPWLEFHYLFNLPDLALMEGDAEQALVYAEQLRQFYSEAGPEKRSVSEVFGWLGAGRALIALGRLEEAASAYRRVMEVADASQHLDQFAGDLSSWAVPAVAGLAHVAFRQGDLPSASEYVEMVLERAPDYDYSDGWIDLIMYRVFQACNDPRAGHVLEEARGALLEQAAKISDEGMRQSFLQNIPEHREILNLR